VIGSATKAANFTTGDERRMRQFPVDGRSIIDDAVKAFAWLGKQFEQRLLPSPPSPPPPRRLLHER
jgi:hypothetical protein